MVNDWEPGTQYDLGSVVVYDHVQYRVIQPHRSQVDWTPNVTPALWGREYSTDHDGQERPWDEHNATNVTISPEEKKKGWNDLTPERRRQLEEGGGLLVGAALLGGGFWYWKKHQKHEDERNKAKAWGLQNWMTEAQARTEEFHRNGSRGQATWVLSHGNQIPEGAFIGGADIDGTPLYVIRTFFEGGIHPGKISQNFKGGLIGYGDKEEQVDNYEILLAEPNNVRWVPVKPPFTVQAISDKLVDGGREADGTPLFIAQAQYENGDHPGKTSEKLGVAHITFSGDEKTVDIFNVLVYN